MASNADGNPVTIRHLVGEGDWELARKQAEKIPKAILDSVKEMVEKVFQMLLTRVTCPVLYH